MQNGFAFTLSDYLDYVNHHYTKVQTNFLAGIQMQVPKILLWPFCKRSYGELSILFKTFFVLCESVKKIGGPSSSIVWFPIWHTLRPVMPTVMPTQEAKQGIYTTGQQ